MGLLDGKIAIVTGAGNGVGRGEAIELADQGAKVVVNDLGGAVTGDGADKKVADEVVDVIKSRGGEAVANYDDVSDWSGAKNIIDTAIEAFGGLDVLVCNAGILRDQLMVKLEEKAFDAVIGVHLKGTVACMHHASAYWREQSKAGNQRRASIINTVSSAGLRGNVGQTAYGAAKAGIAAVTRIASMELDRYGVRANAIAPGGFTRMVGQAMSDIEVKNPEEYDEFNRMNPGNSAPMVAWLASDEALHVTGQVFRAVGSDIAFYEPWETGATVSTEGRWDPAKIGKAINSEIFGTVATGLKMGG